jgi:isopenicillin N synthase-like dioxygenase
VSFFRVRNVTNFFSLLSHFFALILTKNMSTKNEEYENLPLISYRLLKSNDEAELARLKHALVDSEYGFFQLEIDDDFAGEDKFGKVIKRVYDSGRKFFKELREDAKKQYVHTQYETFETGGYVPLFEEYAYKANEIACVESFDLVRDIDKEEEEEKMDFTKQPSGARGRIDWPIEVPEMKHAFNNFYRKCDEIARILFLSFAKALSTKDERAFEKHFSKHSHCAMRFMRYPQVEHINDSNPNDITATTITENSNKKSDVKEVGVSEHTDFEMMTFLHQNERGLHVKKRSGGKNNRDGEGEWIAAPILQEDEAKFLVIISDGLEALTNGTYKATPHRVERPENGERFSIVRFNGVDAETEMDALPEFEFGNNIGAKRKRGKTTATQLDLIATKVQEADRNLKDLVKRKKHPKEVLTSNPERFAQLLIMAKDDDNQWHICLVLHKAGEFAERYTGFIGKVETWYDLNVLAETSIFAACEALEENIALPENAKTRVTEKARFRFHGWLKENKMAIEHECVLILNSREKEALLKDYTEADKVTKESISVVPTWFKVEDTPYAEMPEDDVHWYPKVIDDVIASEEKDIHSGYFTFEEASGTLSDFEIKTYRKISSI